MFDWLYLWNLIWSFFVLLGLVFVPVFAVMIYFTARPLKARSGSSDSSTRPETEAATGVREDSRKRAA